MKKGHTVSVDDLPAECLLQVFSSLNFQQRLETLPLVCKRWNEVLQMPSTLWETIKLGQQGSWWPRMKYIQKASLTNWFRKRGSSVRNLSLGAVLFPRETAEWLSITLPYMCANLRTFVATNFLPEQLYDLLRCCRQLRGLVLQPKTFSGEPELFDRQLQVLTELPHLEVLALELESYAETEPPSSIGAATNLQKLILGSVESLPTCFNTLTNLRTLVLKDYKGTVFPQAVIHLRLLETLEIYWLHFCRVHAALFEDVVLPCELSQLTNLEVLGLGYCPTMQRLANVSNLTSLQVLTLAAMELTEFPSFVSGLKNLRQLCMPLNSISTVPTWLESMHQLRYLGLGCQTMECLEFTVPKEMLRWAFLEGIELTVLAPDRDGDDHDFDVSLITRLNFQLGENREVTMEPRWGSFEEDEGGMMTYSLEEMWYFGAEQTPQNDEFVQQAVEYLADRLRCIYDWTVQCDGLNILCLPEGGI